MNNEYFERDAENQVLRQCPDCRLYVHMPELSVQRCEHCGLITDFTHFTTPEQKVCLFVGRYLRVPHLSLGSTLGRVALFVALPAVLLWTMLVSSVETPLSPKPWIATQMSQSGPAPLDPDWVFD